MVLRALVALLGIESAAALRIVVAKPGAYLVPGALEEVSVALITVLIGPVSATVGALIITAAIATISGLTTAHVAAIATIVLVATVAAPDIARVTRTLVVVRSAILTRSLPAVAVGAVGF